MAGWRRSCQVPWCDVCVCLCVCVCVSVSATHSMTTVWFSPYDCSAFQNFILNVLPSSPLSPMASLILSRWLMNQSGLTFKIRRVNIQDNSSFLLRLLFQFNDFRQGDFIFKENILQHSKFLQYYQSSAVYLFLKHPPSHTHTLSLSLSPFPHPYLPLTLCVSPGTRFETVCV